VPDTCKIILFIAKAVPEIASAIKTESLSLVIVPSREILLNLRVRKTKQIINAANTSQNKTSVVAPIFSLIISL
jgi:hypothetical protein